MGFFNFDVKKLLLIIFIAALPLLSINMQRRPDELPWYLLALGYASNQVENLYVDFSTGVKGTTSLYLDLINIKKENRLLQRDNSEMRAQLAGFDELRLENERLNKLLGFKQKTKMELLSAKVIGRDIISNYQTIQINVGREQGLKKFLAVITVDGVVGYVIRLEQKTASVLMVTDRYAVVDALVQRTRARGIVEGKSRTSCRLRYIERANDVAVGDVIVTSGLVNNFPKGFPIARVTSVEETKFGVSQRVELAPIVNPANLEEVFVIMNPNSEEFTLPTPGSEEQAS